MQEDGAWLGMPLRVITMYASNALTRDQLPGLCVVVVDGTAAMPFAR